MEKKWKLFIFLETIAALGLKVAWGIQLNEFMNWVSIKGQGHSDFNVKTCFSQKQLGVWSQSSYESLRENGNENLYK